MPQIVVSEYAGDHGFTYGNGADAYTGIMTALCNDLGFLVNCCNGLARCCDGTGRFYGKSRNDILTGRDAT